MGGFLSYFWRRLFDETWLIDFLFFSFLSLCLPFDFLLFGRRWAGGRFGRVERMVRKRWNGFVC